MQTITYTVRHLQRHGFADRAFVLQHVLVDPELTDLQSIIVADHAAKDCRTYGLDAVVTRCGNNYGPRQFPEKLIPLFITNALDDRELPLYGDGLNVRDWIHVEDHCAGILAALERGKAGRVYNISAGCTLANRDVCRRLLDLLGKPESLVRRVADRPGHDRRYALDASRIQQELGWQPRIPFAEGLAATVDWYRVERAWWERVKSGEYRRFYAKLYGDRLRSAPAERPERGKR